MTIIMRFFAGVVSLCLTLSAVACSAPNGADQVQEADAKPGYPSGVFVIVDARRASDVAAPFDPTQVIPIGEQITFTEDGVEIEGAACGDWQILGSNSPIIFPEEDPNLIDLTLGPVDADHSVGDQRINITYEIICEDETVTKFLRIDDRVLVMPWANSELNLILEKPLSHEEVKKYQQSLKSVKYYDGDLTGELDEATLKASRFWYEDRARLSEDQPIPLRPAITENLLDTLGVLGSEK